MQQVTYRPAREGEVPEAVDVFTEAVTDLYARLGAVGATPPPREAIETNYLHIHRTGIFRVAEEAGRLVAVCHAVVRGPLWFLSGFWALPRLQGRGVGGPLLRQVMGEGAAAGARVFFTWSSPDTTAMASYLRAGMLPGYPVLTFAGTPQGLRDDGLGAYEVGPLEPPRAAQIDEEVRAVRREVDHRFWAEVSGHEGRLVRRGGRDAAYFYVNNGTVGPAAWADSGDADAVLALALREASRGAEQVRLMVPGVNHRGLRFALASGLRLAAFSHLLTSAPFGRLEQYLASGPSLF